MSSRPTQITSITIRMGYPGRDTSELTVFPGVDTAEFRTLDPLGRTQDFDKYTIAQLLNALKVPPELL